MARGPAAPPSGSLWLVVLAVALAFGASARGPQTPAQRAAALDGILKCPSCDGISVADSSASTAAAVRQLVLARVRQGQSDQQIEQYLVSRYGPSILLRPPTTGITAVVWVVPLLAAVGGAGGLGLFFWRRRRPVAAAVSPHDRALVDRALSTGQGPETDRGRRPAGRHRTVTRQELEDERTFLLRSLEDLDREHEAGDLSDEDHAVLRDGYIARTAEVLKALDGRPSACGQPPPRYRQPAPASLCAGPGGGLDGCPPAGRHRRRWSSSPSWPWSWRRPVWPWWPTSVPGLPGESVTGSVTLTPAQQTARTLAQAGDAREPGRRRRTRSSSTGPCCARTRNQEQALAEVGWLEYEAGAEARRPPFSHWARARSNGPSNWIPVTTPPTSTWVRCCWPKATQRGRGPVPRFPGRPSAAAKVTAAVPFIVKAFSDAHLTPPSLPVGATTTYHGLIRPLVHPEIPNALAVGQAYRRCSDAWTTPGSPPNGWGAALPSSLNGIGS